MTRRSRITAWLLTVAATLALLGIWKLYVAVNHVSGFVLPPPEDVGRSLVDLLGQGRTWTNTWVTVQEILGGFAIALLGGLAVGIVIGEVPVLERAVNPFLVALQVLPKVAVIPLLILWMGFGLSAKITVAAVFAFFPVVAGTRAGIRSVDPGHLDLATTLGASRRQRLAHIILPSALPSILTGAEVAIVFATVGAVVAEYLAGSAGLGWMAVTSLNQLQVDDLFAVIVLLAIVGYLVYAAVAALHRILVPWHPSATDRLPGL